MAITYKVHARRNPITGTSAYYPERCGTSRVSFEQLCERVAHATSATEADATVVITECVHQIALLLADSHSVELGRLGTIFTSFTTRPSATEAEAGAEKVKRVNLRCRFKPAFTARLQPGNGMVELKAADN